MKLTLIRSATLRVEVAGHTLLVDPQLDPAGARDAVPNTPNPRRNPLVDLPMTAEAVVAGVDAVLVTHLHGDHWDATARELLPHDLPLFCQPHDAERLHAEGFVDARPVFGDATLGDLLIARTDGRHGTGEIGERMGLVSGFVLHAPGEPSVYIAGDTILCDEVREALREHRPRLVLVNAVRRPLQRGRRDRDDQRRRRRTGTRVPGRDSGRDPLRDRRALDRDARRPACAARRRRSDGPGARP